jgi:transposase
MSGARFTDEFKRDAVAQVEDRGYPVREVAERLGVSTKSIYTWQKQFSRPAKVIQEVDAQADEIRRLKRDLLRVTEERDILKKPSRVLRRDQGLETRSARGGARGAGFVGTGQ